MRKIIKLFMLFIFPLYGYASIEKNLDEQNKLQITFSSNDTNRIAITNGEISRVFGLGEQFSTQYDESTGQLFFKPITPISHPVTITIISISKQTQDIEAKFTAETGETLLLTEKIDQKRDFISTNINTFDSNEVGVQFIKDILEEKITLEKIPPKHYKQYNKILQKFHCTPKYFLARRDYTAIMYEVTNLKNYEQSLEEASFADKNDKLVMFLKNKLLPKEATKSIVIRGN